jgi:type VI secretion system secreted protein VgrG
MLLSRPLVHYTQTNRPLAITTSLKPDALLLEGFRGTTALSELFHYELDLLAPRGASVPLEKLLGQDVSVRLLPADGIARHFHGFISKLSRGRRDAEFTRYRAEFVPRLWLLTRNLQYRIFQQQTVPEILAAMLTPLRPNVELAFTAVYHARDYCVQYRESDFAFISRLMEEEGIFYYFKHSADKHVLVITDDSAALPTMPEPIAVPLRELADAPHELTHISRWEESHEVRAGQYTLWDHCFELTGQKGRVFQTLEGQASLFDTGADTGLKLAVSRELEVFDYPGGYAHRYDGVAPGGAARTGDLKNIPADAKRSATLRLEADAAQSMQAHGASNCGRLEPGYQFELAGEAEPEMAGRYLATRVEHDASASGFRSGEEQRLEYRNTFSCLAHAVRYRPQRRTPKPTIAGVQTATVVGVRMTGPEGQHSDSPLRTPDGRRIEMPPLTDKYGRVKVQFHWDRQGQFDLGSSCWVRVSQTWAGNRSGAFFWPRPGHEVVVSFAEGDPDRPLITGSVYNAVNMPPVALDQPGGNMMNGIKALNVFTEDRANTADRAVAVTPTPSAPDGQTSPAPAVATPAEPTEEEQAEATIDDVMGTFSTLYWDTLNGMEQVQSAVNGVGISTAARFAATFGPTIESLGAILGSACSALGKHPRNYLTWPGIFACFDSDFSQFADIGAAYMAEMKKRGYDPYHASFRTAEMAGKISGGSVLPDFFKDPVHRKLFSLLLQPGSSKMVTGDEVKVTLLGDQHSRVTGGSDVRYVFQNPISIWWQAPLRQHWYLLPTLFLMGGGVAWWQIVKKGKVKFLTDHHMESGILAALAMLFLKMLMDPRGSVEMVAGQKTTEIYGGPRFDIERCRTYRYQDASLFSAEIANITARASKLLAALIYTGYWVGDLLAKFFNEGGDQDPVGAAVVSVNAKEAMRRLHGVLIMLEQRLAIAATARAEAVEAARRVKQALWYTRWVLRLRGAATEARAHVRVAKAKIKNAAGTLVEVALATDPGKADQVASSDIHYGHRMMTARTLSFVAEDLSKSPSLLDSGEAGSIIMSALGKKSPGGAISLNADSLVLLQTDQSWLRVTSTKSNNAIRMGCDTPGKIEIILGKNSGSPEIKLEDGEITLKAGGSLLKPLKGSEIAVSKGEVHIRSGLPGVGSEISLKPTGLKLSFGGTQSIELGKDGIKINGIKVNVSAMSQLQAQGLSSAVQGRVRSGEAGGITQLGGS